MNRVQRITSTSNPQIKAIRALRQRKERDLQGRCFIEGIRLVGEALQTGTPIETLIIAPELLVSAFAYGVYESYVKQGGHAIEVSGDVCIHLFQKEHPQGIGAVVQQRWGKLSDVAATRGMGWVALDAIQDPGNLGTILRTSDAVGCDGVILIGHCVDPYDPAALRAGMGATFSQRLIRASVAECVAWKRRSDYPIIGTSGTASADFQAITYPRPLILLMGSERLGIDAQLLAITDQLVRIPMVGRSDSLNLAVATGVVLYAMLGQRRG